MPIKRAILSVSDKSGLIDLARYLRQHDVEILSTGGTARHLRDAGIDVTPISAYTGAPEVFGGRVKTLHPKVFGGILFNRSDEGHAREAGEHAIGPIDLVAVNLYPFEETIARGDVPLAEAVEQIDIGGPSMLRAAAKNHRHVVVLCDPLLYTEFMAAYDGSDVPEDFRRRAAAAVFRLTSEYDHAIATYLEAAPPAVGSLPARIELLLDQVQPLRYGENPQQAAGFYRTAGGSRGGFVQLQGKELSYNNILDLDAAWRLSASFDEPAAVVIKHTNPCGAATAADVAEALRLALETDPVSAFGGIIGFNREFDLAAAEAVGSLFLEVIVAPSFSEEALAAMAKKKNLRLVAADDLASELDIRSAAGGFLLQAADRIAPSASWNGVTKIAPDAQQMAALDFAWRVCAGVKSNAIVLARGTQTVGVGAGQMSRVDSAKLAVMKAILPVEGSVAASDAFFPFRDGIDMLADAGVTAIVQPGGSVRDDEVIAAADERGIAMVFTGERHFRH
jgi:phosphoribosylaminoimidazolecarboxamide formyltransferase / IMP cyclohydrolase